MSLILSGSGTIGGLSVGGVNGAQSIVNAPTGTIAAVTVQAAIDEIVSDQAGSGGASLVGYLPGGTGAVASTVQGKLRERVSVLDFYANGVSGVAVDPTGAIDSTLGIQAAIDYANSVVQAEPSNGFYATSPTIHFPKGIYTISSALTYYRYSRFSGERSIIEQTDNVENVFYSDTPYQNSWQNLIFRGGAVQVYCLNGGATPGPGGLEGVLVHIDDCEFYGLARGITTSIKCQKEAPMGGEQVHVNDCRFFSFQKAIWSDFDCTYINHNFFETRNDSDTTNNGSWFTSYLSWVFTENTLVPGGDTTTGTERYFDNYGSLNIQASRFGAESGGQPIVYNYTAANQTIGYPYQDGGAVIVSACPILSAGVRTDQGVVVAKAGLPKVINIQGNMYGAIGPFINTQSLTGGISLATWLAGAGGAIGALYMTFTVVGNSMWGATLTHSAVDDQLLYPYTTFNYQQQNQTQMLLPYQTSKSITTEVGLGKTYAQTSASGATSIVDTGIYFDRDLTLRPELAYGNSSIYDVYVTGNPASGGSGNYRDIVYGQLEVVTGFGGGVVQLITFNKLSTAASTLTVTCVFWDGVTETTSEPTGTTDSQLRIKVGGYIGGTGDYQSVRIIKRM
jgi:hypothetical protein